MPDRISGIGSEVNGVARTFLIVVLMGPDALTAIQLGDSQLVAMLAVLGGAVCYAIAAVLARLRPAGDALVSAAATTVIGAMLLFPVMMQGLTSVPLADARDRALTIGESPLVR